MPTGDNNYLSGTLDILLLALIDYAEMFKVLKAASQLNQKSRKNGMYRWRRFFYYRLGYEHHKKHDGANFICLSSGLNFFLTRVGMVPSCAEDYFWDFIHVNPELITFAKALLLKYHLFLGDRWSKKICANERTEWAKDYLIHEYNMLTFTSTSFAFERTRPHILPENMGNFDEVVTVYAPHKISHSFLTPYASWKI
jgi:hypothetical protein